MRILCATDLLPKSDAAIERAGILSDQLSADLTLLHVVVPGESQQALEQSLQAASSEMQSRVRPPRWRAQRAPNLAVHAGNAAKIILETATQFNDLAARVNRVISGVDDLLTQLTSLQGQIRRSATTPPPPQQLLSDIGSTIGELRHFRDSVLARPLAGLGYRQYPRLREEVQTVSGMVSRPLMPPTAGELLRMGELKTEADQAQARLDAIVQNRISKINQALSGTPHVIVPQRAGPIIP